MELEPGLETKSTGVANDRNAALIEQSTTTSYLCLCLSLFAAVVALPGEAAEFRLQPFIIVSEEYTDNAYLVPAGANPLSDWTTRLAPGVQMTYKAPLWDWDAKYIYDYRHHTENVFRPDSDEKFPAARLSALVRIVPEFLFLDVRDDYERVSLNVIRDYTQESSFVNQTDRNVFSVNPYTTTRMSDRAMFTAGYVYRNTWYKDPQSIDTVENVGYGDLKREVSKRMAVNGGVWYIKNENIVKSFARTEVLLGQTYAYAEGSSLATKIGYSRLNIEAEEKARARDVLWDVRETHRFMTVTLLFATGRAYIPDPRNILRREDSAVMTVWKDTERTILMVNGGVYKFNNANTLELEGTSHRVGGSATYRVTTHTKITGSLDVDWSDDAAQQNRTWWRKYGFRLDHTASETLTWALDYRYGQAEDREVYLRNYRSNRFLAEIIKNF